MTFLYITLIICPIRYWPLANFIDNTWLFALNYSAAIGLVAGRDIAWTTGPLGYLVLPQNIGNNLAHAILFQCAAWAVLAAVFGDLFFRSGFPGRNLAGFTIFFGLSAPLYWFDYLGLENLLLAAMLVLLINVYRRENRTRYVLALVIAGTIPLIKLTGGMSAAGAIAGFLMARVIRARREAWRDIAMAATIPLAVAGFGAWSQVGSLNSLVEFFRSSIQIAGGYSSAMSITGDSADFIAAAGTLLLIGALMWAQVRASKGTAAFLALLLAVPLFVSFKHGFVRQDFHVINFFCFSSLALGLISLVLPLEGTRLGIVFLVLLPFGVIWMENVPTQLGFFAFGDVNGTRTAQNAFGAIRWDRLKGGLDAQSALNIPPETRLEPAVRRIVGQSTIASLSITYSSAMLDGLNLKIYPVIQRYSAYTPYLDRRNAEWITNQGPQFLLFDGLSIDRRHPWAETPAMWLEVYRWYDTRLLGDRALLLERRREARQLHLQPIGRFDAPLAAGIEIPRTAGFFTLSCTNSVEGKLRKLLFRVPEVHMAVRREGRALESFRALPEMLSSPVLGALPSTLPEFADVFDANKIASTSATKIDFAGPGMSSYSSCEGVLLAAY